MNGRAPKRPREPGPSDCCGSGCSRCVWDVYFDDLAKYEEFVKGLSGQGKETGGDEDDEFGSSSHDDDDDDDDGEAHDFVGSVVIKYVDAPTNEERVITPLVAVSKKLERFLPIHDVQLLSSSSSHEFDGNTLKEGQGQAVQIVDVLLENSCELKRPMNFITPSPGDVVEVFIPNDYDMHNSGYSGEVEKLCDRLNLNPSQWCEIHRSPFVPPTHFPPWLPFQSQIQIRTLLAYFVDISSCGYLLRPTFFSDIMASRNFE
ncbi:oxidoreductase [Trypanosoma cruzi Dm28c]|uniref:Oxidoreductase n=1 Tax=Trypanosoma cruzi Dm28c TaxID=1416333 RepID=V5BDF8_TRYCR|nr:oxidoreductase [Trypanosoma cruzi Dm28c]